tara:strand:- start:36 stop:1145 length:1110 start_codon:yes stop_codon:yes gene_type:complete
MNIGIPKEVKDNEYRVSITPYGVFELSKLGNKVFVEKNAGIGSGFTDKMYVKSGAHIVETAQDVFEKSELIVKVKEPQPSEIKMINEKHIVFTFFHFAADIEMTKNILETGSTSIAYETVQNPDGSLPILVPMSEVAGRMSIQNGAKCLEGSMGGMGKLLSGVPGVESATVSIIGGGVVGSNAAKLAAGLGAKVNILDVDMDRLRYLDDFMPRNVQTLYSNNHNINSVLYETDLLIGAVLVVGSKAPNLISKNMLSNMKYGSVIVDVAVDQGGCVETCKPTTHRNPTYIVENVVHYCVSNMPGSVSHTSTIALTNITLEYIKQISTQGCLSAFKLNNSLKLGLNTYKGEVTHSGVAESFNLNFTHPDSI